MICYKTEINPTKEQKLKINKTIGTCRFIYNLYLEKNKELYAETGGFISGMSFSVWMNNIYLRNTPERSWIKEVSSKSVKKSIMNAETAYKRFFRKLASFPRFKKRNKKECTMYFVGESSEVDRHRIKIPTLGWVQLKEKAYIPTNIKLMSGTISKKAGRYYVSALFAKELVPMSTQQVCSEGIGIDLGINKFAVVSTEEVFENINKTKKLIKLNKILKHRQRCLSKKFLLNKGKGEATGFSAKNINKLKLQIQKIHATITNIRVDYINKVINTLVRTKPEFITVETLNILGMLKNKHLARSIAAQNFYLFKSKLLNKCKQFGIELRSVSRWFSSSKICSVCGYKHTGLRLVDRTFNCPNCKVEIDRDLNASFNLRNATEYLVA